MGFWSDGFQPRRSRSRSSSRERRKRSSSSRHDGPYSRPSAARSNSSFITNLTGYSVDSAHLTRAEERAKEKRAHPPSSSSQSRGLFASFGGTGGSTYSNYNYGHSSSSGHGHSGRARPRRGFVAKIRRWLRELYAYMKRHPLKVFMLVILPLITGGALTKILSVVGIRLPPGIERMLGSSMTRGVDGNQRYYANGGARDFVGGSALGGMMGAGLGGSLGGLLSMAKMFVLDEEDEILRDIGYTQTENQRGRSGAETPIAYPGRPILSRAQSSEYGRKRERDENGNKEVNVDDEEEETERTSSRINLQDDELSDAQIWRDE